jgi:hypothetical protein
VELTAVDRNPFTHSEQTVSAALAVAVDAAAAVEDLNFDVSAVYRTWTSA